MLAIVQVFLRFFLLLLLLHKTVYDNGMRFLHLRRILLQSPAVLAEFCF